jgi:hypothetical protein
MIVIDYVLACTVISIQLLRHRGVNLREFSNGFQFIKALPR